MTDTQFKLVPYAKVDGIPTFKNSELADLYDQLVEEKLVDILLHDGSINTPEQFVQYLTEAKDNLFYVVLDTKVNQPAAIFWVNRIEQTHCYCHFCVFKKWHGSGVTVQMGRLAMAHLFSIGFHTVMGMLPESNRAARDYLLRVGLKDVGKVPNLIWSKDKNAPVAGHLMYITKEDLDDVSEQ